jgi:hypothetical protein
MEISQAGIPQGRQIIGRYVGVETVRKRPSETQEAEGKPGTPVKGMFEIKVVSVVGDSEREHGVTFFETDQDGDVTKISRTVAEGTADVGDLVSVRFKSHGTTSKGKTYANDTALSMIVLAKAGK